MAMISPRVFYTRFKPIRNQLRRYSPISVLRGCLENLYSPAVDRIEQLKKHPWMQLLLVKWAFLDEEADREGRPAISPHQLNRILQQVHELSELARMPNDYEDLTLFMRAIAYQQFPYQISRNIDGLARQQILFSKVQDNHFFRTCIQESLGFSIDEFLRLALCVWARFQLEPGYVLSRRWFSNLEGAYSSKCIDAFLSSISIDVEHISEKLRGLEGLARGPLEYLQRSPFASFPLIRVGQDFWCISPHILQQCLEHFIFDFLKKTRLERFQAAFGSAFEAYVGNLLGEAGLTFSKEIDIERTLPGTGKVVDFIVVDGDANIFIDAKGVEMAPRGKVAHLREVVRGATSSSLMKAFEQGQEVCSRIAHMGEGHSVIRPQKCNYLLAITYKELYISNGLSLSAAVGDVAISRIQEKFAEENLIPLENIYFLSIDEFEGLMALIKAARIGLVEGLERAKSADVNPVTRNFMFMMHLRAWPESKGLNSPLHDHLQPIFESMLESLSV